MDKIKDLLKQLGASPELTNSILSEMKAWRKREERSLQEDFKNKLEKAKKICLEEFESEKAKLARKVEVFLEANAGKVEREAKRQSAIGESESSKTLRNIKCFLEGVSIDGKDKDIQAVKENTARLKRLLDTAIQEGKKYKTNAERANNIATKALERNKLLESKIHSTGTVAESKSESKPAKLESLRQKQTKPKTQRKILKESQVPAAKKEQTGGTFIDQIASEVDESPAFM